MLCPNCHKTIPDGSKFCPECGTDLLHAKSAPKSTSRRRAEETVEIGGQQVTKNIRLCADNKYRWSYEFKMMKNPVIFLTVLKVLGMSAAIVMILITAFSLNDWIHYGFRLEEGSGKVLLIIIAVFLGITVLSYIILAALYGWKYQVLFEMDENGVTHIQMPKQVKKAQTIGLLTALAGAMSHNPTMAGAGLLSTAKSTSTSEWAKVKKVKIRKGMQTIHVNMGLDHNQVYAEPEDFDFVRDYIVSHCSGAKIK